MDKFKNASSKLGKAVQEYTKHQEIVEDVGIITKNKADSKIKTFRLSFDDLKNLENIRVGVNKKSRSIISDNKIIKALIHIGLKANPQKILNALKEII